MAVVVSPLLDSTTWPVQNRNADGIHCVWPDREQTSSDVAASATFFSQDGSSKTFPCTR